MEGGRERGREGGGKENEGGREGGEGERKGKWKEEGVGI